MADRLDGESSVVLSPYKYKGALYPKTDKIILAPRANEISTVFAGIKKGDYWAILGPRQIGKSTFLYQLREALEDCLCIHIDFQIFPKKEEAFYKYLTQLVIKNLASTVSLEFPPDWDASEGRFCFSNFLKSIRCPRKIVFLLDEIGEIPEVESFLKIWRNLFNSRIQDETLKNFSVVITGADDLTELTLGQTSPYNISEKLYLGGLALEEVEEIVARPLETLKITFEKDVKERLLSLVSGHPQLLQNLCSILVLNSAGHGDTIGMADLDKAIEKLFSVSHNIRTLDAQLKEPQFYELVRKILRGDKIEYLRYRKYSFSGIGAIIRGEDGCCMFRNQLYGDYLGSIVDEDEVPERTTYLASHPSPGDDVEFETVIHCDSKAVDFKLEEEEKDFLKQLFSQRTEITIKNMQGKWGDIDFSAREKLMYCYLAYKNFKALREEGALRNSWEEIPISYEYRVSSNHTNNVVQQPEWDAFRKALERYDVPFIGDSIKTWIYSIRRKLVREGVGNPIYSGKGRGDGYVLKGTVTFVNK